MRSGASWKKAATGLILVWAGVSLVAASRVGGAIAPVQSGAAAAPANPDRALIDRYCVTCHNSRRKVGDLALDALDPTQVSGHGDVWEKVIRKMQAGSMPPVGMPRPDDLQRKAFLVALEGQLDAEALAHPNPGRPAVFHRLNRTEYRNAIRDLLAVDIDVASLLPSDTESYGFDNIGDVLGVNPLLLERYLGAARKISRVAIGSADTPTTSETYRLSPELTQDEHLDGLPLGTRGGAAIRHLFPVDGNYELRIRLSRDYNQTINGLAETLDAVAPPHQVEIALDGERLKVFAAGDGLAKPGERQKYDGFFAIDPRLLTADEGMTVRVPVKAGSRELTVAFIKRTAALLEDIREPFARADVEQGDTHEQPYVGSVTITGPYNPQAATDTPSRRAIFRCRPATQSDEASCARTILGALARHAYRRPVTSSDLQLLIEAYEEGHRGATFEAGIQRALLRILVSPSFLFRIEHDPAGVAPGTASSLSAIDLASRLSFFLWSSIPDEPLLDVAERGTLTNPAELERQTRRMLQDPRSAALIENFGGQWLYLRNLQGVRPDRMMFPDFDENLRQAFRRETELFIDGIVREDRSVLELLDANYTFVNERLARHYGISGVSGEAFRRVTVTDGIRGGLLGQGSLLTVRSHANRTSPVLRGVWILDNLLGAAPPPPPPNVPDLQDTDSSGKVLSMRGRMEQHRANPSCASCHSQMDPLGLALENFDAIGQWRNASESNEPIDAAGRMPDGTTFEGAAQLKRALLAHSEQFVSTLTEKLLTYAVGRGLEWYDASAVRRIVRDAGANDNRFSTILLGVVRSMPFQMRRAGDRPLDSP